MPRPGVLILALFLVVAPAVGGSADTGKKLVLRTPFTCSVSGRHLRLSDVVSIDRDDHGVWPLVADLILPLDANRYLTRGTVRRRLEDAGLPASCFELVGPALCTVKRSGS